MIKRLLHALFAAWLGMFACNVAHAQVGTILMHVFGSMLQGQIDAWDKANDPNRGLREFNAKDNFSGRELYAPSSQQKFEGSYESGGFIRNDDSARPSYEATTVRTEPVPAPPASE
jgi:hypothetical protein